MDDELWLGSLSLYQSYTSKTEAFSAALLSGSFNQTDSEDPTDTFSLFDNVGVIDITGTLTNDDSWWTRYSGDTSYNDIRRSLIEAVTHSEVQCIVMNIDSGGGTPNGLADVADMVTQISASGTPVYAYTGGNMCSAAYWLGASAVKVYAGETADVGSIGVISIHKEYTEMFKKDGVKVTVFRAGEEKALNNPFEKLTDKAKESTQSRLDALYDVFINNIAHYRHVPPDFVREHMANGQEFIGQQALDAGLVDEITTLDDLITGLQSKINKQSAGKETPMAKNNSRVLTQAQRAAMLEGVPLDAALKIEAEESGENPESVDPALEVKAEDTVLKTEPDPDPVPAVTESELVSFLRAELSAKTTEIVQLNTQLNEAKASLASLNTVHEPMKKIVAASVGRMQVGLGAPFMDLSDLPAEIVLQQHAKTTEIFCSKFPVGGIASLPSEELNTHKEEPVTAVTQARLRQNQI